MSAPFVVEWSPAATPFAVVKTTVECPTLRAAKGEAFVFAKRRGPGVLRVKDMTGTLLASRRFHQNSASNWETTFSGGFL